MSQLRINKMIKPGTPVRCRYVNRDGETGWSPIQWFYVGPMRDGTHVVEDLEGEVMSWSYAEELPRELKRGDPVLVSDKSLDDCGRGFDEWTFHGMYEGRYVCLCGYDLAIWKYAKHEDEK